MVTDKEKAGNPGASKPLHILNTALRYKPDRATLVTTYAYSNNASERPTSWSKRSGVLFQRKRSIIQSKRPPSKQKCEKIPGHRLCSKRPRLFQRIGVNAPGRSWQDV